MATIMLHKGGERVTKDVLDMIPLPDKTDTYIPVPHRTLVDTLTTVSRDLLGGFDFLNDEYALAREGQQLFGVLNYMAHNNSEIGLSIALRNSYDKSMSVGIAVGGKVFICDNLALRGDITILRAHTKNVWKDLEGLIVQAIYNSKFNYYKILEDAVLFKGKNLTDINAYELMGVLYGYDVITVRQLSAIRSSWEAPQIEEFKDKNLWSFYNHCTDAMKACPPIARINKQIELHNNLEVYARC